MMNSKIKNKNNLKIELIGEYITFFDNRSGHPLSKGIGLIFKGTHPMVEPLLVEDRGSLCVKLPN